MYTPTPNTRLFFGMICRPSTKKGIGIYLQNPVVSINTLETVGIWSRGYGCGSKPCTPGEHQNRLHIGVHPPQNRGIGFDRGPKGYEFEWLDPP